LNSLVKLIAELSIKFQIPLENILGHKDVTFGKIDWSTGEIIVQFSSKKQTTNCPGKNFKLIEIREAVSKNLKNISFN